MVVVDGNLHSQVLRRRRGACRDCWIITQTPADPRAIEMARKYDATLVSSHSCDTEIKTNLAYASNRLAQPFEDVHNLLSRKLLMQNVHS